MDFYVALAYQMAQNDRTFGTLAGAGISIGVALIGVDYLGIAPQAAARLRAVLVGLSVALYAGTVVYAYVAA